MPLRRTATPARALTSAADVAKGALRAAGALLRRRLLGAAIKPSRAKPACAAVLPSRAVAVVAGANAVGNGEAAVVAVRFDVRPSALTFVAVAAGLVPREAALFDLCAAVAMAVAAEGAVAAALPSVAAA